VPTQEERIGLRSKGAVVPCQIARASISHFTMISEATHARTSKIAAGKSGTFSATEQARLQWAAKHSPALHFRGDLIRSVHDPTRQRSVTCALLAAFRKIDDRPCLRPA